MAKGAKKDSKGGAEALDEAAGVAGWGVPGEDGLPAFSLLASAAACLSRARKALAPQGEADAKDLATAEPARKAWAVLVEGGNFALTALMQGKAFADYFGSVVVIVGDGGPAYRKIIAAGYTEEEVSVVAKGVEALASRVRAAVTDAKMAAAGAAYAPMLGHPGSVGDFAYPLEKKGVQVAAIKVDGKKTRTLVGGALSGGGRGDSAADVDNVEMSMRRALHESKLDEDLGQAHAKRLAGVAARGARPWAIESISEGAARFSTLTVDEPTIKGDAVLPSLAAVQGQFEAWTERGAVGIDYASPAFGPALEAGLSAVAMALAPAEAAKVSCPMEFDARFGLLAGPLGQSEAAWEGERSPAEMARMGARMFHAIATLDPEHVKQRGYNEADAADVSLWLSTRANEPKLIKKASRLALAMDGMASSNKVELDFPQDPDDEQDFFDDDNAYVFNSKRDFDGSGALANVELFYENESDDRERRLPLGGAMSLARMGMRGADPELALAQWATRAALAIFLVPSDGHPSRSQEGAQALDLPSGARAFMMGAMDPRVRVDWSPGRKELALALGQYCEAVTRAQRIFVGAALEAARGVEARWMSAQGLGQAFEQAMASGSVSSKALAWAMANPMSSALASQDPMARMAAKMSRAFGLAPAADAELAAGIRRELGELGCSEGALELLAGSSALRSHFEELAVKAGGRKEGSSGSSLRWLAAASRAASAAAAQGLAAAQAHHFVKALVDSHVEFELASG